MIRACRAAPIRAWRFQAGEQRWARNYRSSLRNRFRRRDGKSPQCLFVSSTLSTWTTAQPEWFARDFQINDTVYRRLDPEYYAWLRSRMVLAKAAASSGRLDGAAFEDLRVRFNAVHEWAIRHFGEEQLLAAVRASSCR